MARAQPLTFAQFEGINNVNPVNRLTPRELVAASNVDIDDTRAAARRGGFGTVLAGTAGVSNGAHSIYYPPNGAPDLCLYRKDDALCRLMPDRSTVVLKTGLAAGARMFYAAAPTRIFMSDGIWQGVTDGEAVYDWGITPPAVQPVAAVAGTGKLPKGKYLFALTFLREDGEESGTPVSGAIELTGVGGIDFSAIAVSSQPGVTLKVLYLTKPNGQRLLRAIVMPNAATTAAYYGKATDLKGELETQLMREPPRGRVLEFFNGRMLVGDGPFLWYNPIPYRLELFSARAVRAHATRVTALAAMDDGVFVGTENAIDWHAGVDFAAASVSAKAKYGAAFGGRAYLEGARVLDGSISGRAALLVTKRGVAACGNSGFYRNLTENRYLYDAPATVAAVARDMSGWSQLIAVMR